MTIKYTEENRRMKEQLIKKDSEVAKEALEISKLKATQNQLIETLKQLSSTVKMKNAQLEKMKHDVSNEEGKKKGMKEEVVRLSNEIEENKKAMHLFKDNIKTLEAKEQKACATVSELVGELRSRSQEFNTKDIEIEAINQELCKKDEAIGRLESNLEHLRDENTKVKNNIKQVKQSKEDYDTKTLFSNLKELKKYISEELLSLNQRIDTIATEKPAKAAETAESRRNHNTKFRSTWPSMPKPTWELKFQNNGPEMPEEVSSSESDEEAHASRKRERVSVQKLQRGNQTNIRAKRSNVNVRPEKPSRVPIYLDPGEENESRRGIRTVPGERSYSDTVSGKKRTHIFSTSITKCIKEKDFNEDYADGVAEFHRFPGK